MITLILLVADGETVNSPVISSLPGLGRPRSCDTTSSLSGTKEKPRCNKGPH